MSTDKGGEGRRGRKRTNKCRWKGETEGERGTARERRRKNRRETEREGMSKDKGKNKRSPNVPPKKKCYGVKGKCGIEQRGIGKCSVEYNHRRIWYRMLQQKNMVQNKMVVYVVNE